MADDIVIRVEGLSKKYVIGHESERERYVALRDVIARGTRKFWRMAADMARGRVIIPGDTVEEVWALRDINFEVRRGEVLGVIGRNGAGKSTLLKILARITEPTEGRVTIKGRVASLLEVGTGFHPELTGRENIFLNGAILGMTRAEIKRKFDEIVAFAEVEKFLDTPVKRYSSGMYVRLAFAVAAHLEPEILIVDEVLAVGDAEFQKKCLGKMQDVAGHGRTVLFVSHNMAAVSQLCPKTIYMRDGELVAFSKTEDVMQSYISSRSNITTTFKSGNGLIVRDPVSVYSDSHIRVALSIVVDQEVVLNKIIMALYSPLSACITRFNIPDEFAKKRLLPNSELGLFCQFAISHLAPENNYYWNILIEDSEGKTSYFERIGSFDVLPDRKRSGRYNSAGTILAVEPQWHIEQTYSSC